MTHQFTNTNGEQFLAVGVPLIADRFHLFNDVEKPYLSYFVKEDTKREYLPNSKYEIIGISSELTEEQVIGLGLVEIIMGRVKDYLNSKIVDTFSLSLIESLQSRLKSFGFVLENEKVLVLKTEDK